MLTPLIAFLAASILRSPFRNIIWKSWYNYFAHNFGHLGITLMNYGYANLEMAHSSPFLLNQNANGEIERYCLQLYHYAATRVPIQGKDVLEVGCGRGGGAAYVAQNLNPRSLLGIDLANGNINLCKRTYAESNLKFLVGNAESLAFPSDSFDVVLSIESSHCYPHPERFFSEVFRVLRADGYLILADFRSRSDIAATKELLQLSKFKFIEEEDVTKNVLQAMDLEHERKLAIIHQMVPPSLHNLAYGFAATKDSNTYRDFQSGELAYFLYVLKKEHCKETPRSNRGLSHQFKSSDLTGGRI
ncbi:MAG: class I SAM-dependent methyltransferase [Elainellaceae cyanobacterium]